MIANDEILKLAHAHAERREFNEALALLDELLEELPESEREEIEHLKYFFDVQRSQHLDELHKKASQARDEGDWEIATELIDEARALDPEGEYKGFKELAEQVSQRAREVGEETRSKKKQLVKNLLETTRTIEDIDAAIKLLEELIAKQQDDLEIRSLLDSAQERRRTLLAKVGQIATFEEGEQYEEALKEVNSLIQQGIRELPDVDTDQQLDIYEYRSSLEIKAKVFAEKKAGKYLGQADSALNENKPELALTYIRKALDLPSLPKEREDDLNDLQIKAEHAKEEQEELEATVGEAVDLMNQKGDFEQAIRLLENVLASVPEHSSARTNLDRARQGLERRCIKEVRNALSIAEARLRRKRLAEARAQLEAAAETVEELGDSGDAEALQQRYDQLFAELEEAEEREEGIQGAEDELRGALDSGDLSTAEDILQSLTPEARKDPRISKLRSQLTRRQDVESAVEGVQQALDDGDFEGARKQMQSIKRRRLKSDEIPELAKKVDASYFFHQGRDALAAGDLTAAKRSFNRVRKIGDIFADEAEDELESIAEQQERLKREKKLFSQAVKHQEAGRFEEAHRLLMEVGEDLGPAHKELLKLRAQVGRAWRKELSKEVRDKLKADAYDEAFELSEKLATFKMASDTALISRARLAYHMNRARIAARNGEWSSARAHWLEAEKHDPTSEEIAAGLKEAKKQNALREAATARDVQKRLALLESVFDPHNPDAAVYPQLARELIRAAEYRRAARLADVVLADPNSELAADAEILKRLCQQLEESEHQLKQGAHLVSIELLQKCRKDFPTFDDALALILRNRRQEAVESLWTNAQRLENEGQKLAHTLPLYRELLAIEPSHRDARRRNQELLEELDRYVQDLVHEAQQTKNEPNVLLDQVEEKIREIDSIAKVANKDQGPKLEHWRRELNAKRRDLRTFEDKSKLIKTLLAEAKATGEFQIVEGLQADLANLVSNRYQGLVALSRELREAKDGRRKAEKLRARIEEAFSRKEFAQLDSLTAELIRADPKDDFQLRGEFHLIDPVSKEPITFAELSEWARERQNNLQQLSSWFDVRRPDRLSLEEREDQLRTRRVRAHDRGWLISGLERLAESYREVAERLRDLPDQPLSPKAVEIEIEAREERQSLNGKAEQLAREARRMKEEDDDVRELIEQASQLIDNKEYGAARPIIDQGLEIVPDHEVLRYFHGVVTSGR